MAQNTFKSQRKFEIRYRRKYKKNDAPCESIMQNTQLRNYLEFSIKQNLVPFWKIKKYIVYSTYILPKNVDVILKI